MCKGGECVGERVGKVEHIGWRREQPARALNSQLSTPPTAHDKGVNEGREGCACGGSEGVGEPVPSVEGAAAGGELLVDLVEGAVGGEAGDGDEADFFPRPTKGEAEGGDEG